MTDSSFKGKSGLGRIWNALGYSRDGLMAAWRHEAAFRLEGWLALVAIPLALVLGGNGLERGLLVASVVMVMLVEVLNSALEAVVDRISPERHELSKRAKDLGSAAVLLAFLAAACLWLGILWP